MRRIFGAFKPLLIGEFLLWLIIAHACWLGLWLRMLRLDDTAVAVLVGPLTEAAYLLPPVLAGLFGASVGLRHQVAPATAGLAALTSFGLMALANEAIGVVDELTGAIPAGSDPDVVWDSIVSLAMMALVAAAAAAGAWWAARAVNRRRRRPRG